MVVSAAVFTKT